MNKTGSYTAHVINNDHEQGAQKWLEDHGFADDWEVVVADDKMLMLDYDDRPYDGTLPEQFYVTLGIFGEMVGHDNYFQHTPSKGGNTHAVLHMNTPMPIVERIAWQAAFGSDPKREALHLLSVSRSELNPILLFMRKAEEQKLLGETAMRVNNLNIINMCSASISRASVLAALAKSNLHWEMHQAQVFALEMTLFTEPPTVVETVVTEGMTRELLSRPQTNITLMGLPVVIDNARYPKGLVRLMSGDVELSRIECLAIPMAFMDENDYTEEGRERERQKFAKLTY